MNGETILQAANLATIATALLVIAFTFLIYVEKMNSRRHASRKSAKKK